MAHARVVQHQAADERRSKEPGGSALFYAMSGLFFALFAFVLWYCPRHL